LKAQVVEFALYAKKGITAPQRRQHRKSGGGKLQFIKEVSEEFENMMCEAEEESLYRCGKNKKQKR